MRKRQDKRLIPPRGGDTSVWRRDRRGFKGQPYMSGSSQRQYPVPPSMLPPWEQQKEEPCK